MAALQRILVVGAAGRVGSWVVKEGAARGNEMFALARTPAKLTGLGDHATAVQGDATNMESLDAAFTATRPDVVISTLGHVTGSPPDICVRSLTCMLACCKKHNVKRLVFLAGCLWHMEGDELPAVVRAIRYVTSFTGTMQARFSDGAAAMELMQRERGSSLDWTVARPPYMKEGPPTEVPIADFYTGPVIGVGWSISTGDMARWLLDQASVVDGKWKHAAPAVSN